MLKHNSKNYDGYMVIWWFYDGYIMVYRWINDGFVMKPWFNWFQFIWLVVSTTLKNMLVSWDHYSQLNGKIIQPCSKPPTSLWWVYHGLLMVSAGTFYRWATPTRLFRSSLPTAELRRSGTRARLAKSSAACENRWNPAEKEISTENMTTHRN